MPILLVFFDDEFKEGSCELEKNEMRILCWKIILPSIFHGCF